VTTLDAFNILVGALSGSFVLQEIYHSESGTIVLFFLSIILILMGLLALVQVQSPAVTRYLCNHAT